MKLIQIALLLLMASCFGRKDEVKTNTSAQNDLPTLTALKLDGSRLLTKQLQGKTVLVLFQPDCDHCQREAKQIRENLDAFKAYSLYFISADALSRIAAFAADYGLTGYDNVHFATTEAQYILNNFGPIDAPSLYIYNDSGKLVKKFNGETDIKLILSSL